MDRISRRDLVLGGAVLAAGTAAGPAGAADPIRSVPSLGALAAARGVTYGASIDRTVLTDARLAELYRHQTRIVTTDVALKFGSIRPQPNVADYTDGDALVAFAAQAGLAVRGHTLAWNAYQPDWVDKLSPKEAAYWLDRHIAETVGRYAGRLHSWDVVNEPLWPDDGNPGSLRGGPWFRALGPDYIRRAFVAAHRADPNVRLVLNEASPEWKVAFGPTEIYRTALLRLVDDLQHAGIRLDAVGLECHWFPDFVFDRAIFSKLVRDLAARKLEVYVTELDVNDLRMQGNDTRRDAQVAARYAEIMAAALAEPAVTVIQTWQLSDAQSWLNGVAEPDYHTIRKPRPLPFDRDYAPKPAYHAMADALLR
jgi:endo-1,4-beta-xylanase